MGLFGICPCIPDNEHTTSTIIYDIDDIFILNKISITVILLYYNNSPKSIIKTTKL